MTAPTNEQKPKYTKKVPTEIEYHEKGHWAKGDNILTVVGGLPGETKSPIAFIRLEDYDENKKPILVAVDLEGNELFERTSNLYQLKKQIRENEQRLTKEMIILQAKHEKKTLSKDTETGIQLSTTPSEPEENDRSDELKSTRKANGKYQPKSQSR